MKLTILSTAILVILGYCFYPLLDKSNESERPWFAYAFDPDKQIFHFGFINVQVNYASLDECMQDLNWITKEVSARPTINIDNRTLNQATPLNLSNMPKKPIGCAFASNSFTKTYLINSWGGGHKLEYICQALDPKYTHEKKRYQATLVKMDDSEYICTKLYHIL